MPQEVSSTEIPEDVFDILYEPQRRLDGDLFEFEDVRNAPINTVWTIVEGEEPESQGVRDEDNPPSAGWYALPGFHVVNKLGYVLTKKPWTDPDLIGEYFAPDP